VALGSISCLNFWSRAYTENELTEFSDCLSEGDVFSLKPGVVTLHGGISEEYVPPVTTIQLITTTTRGMPITVTATNTTTSSLMPLFAQFFAGYLDKVEAGDLFFKEIYSAVAITHTHAHTRTHTHTHTRARTHTHTRTRTRTHTNTHTHAHTHTHTHTYTHTNTHKHTQTHTLAHKTYMCLCMLSWWQD